MGKSGDRWRYGVCSSLVLTSVIGTEYQWVCSVGNRAAVQRLEFENNKQETAGSSEAIDALDSRCNEW